jgi:hypothetical protein
MFILMIGGNRDFANKLYNAFTQYLSLGYTYHDIKTEILTSFYNHKDFRWNMFTYRKRGDECLINKLKPNERYYHKELKLVSKPPIVNRDIDRGTLVSRIPEYFLEPVASYTIQEFVRYFYNIMPLNPQEWNIGKTTGIIKYKMDQYGVDRLLFMTDIAASDYKANGTLFNLGEWDEYANKADAYLEEMKYSISDNTQYYSLKKRNIFNE